MHFMQARGGLLDSITLGKRRAAVQVRVESKKLLRVCERILVLGGDVELAKVPTDIVVVDGEGKVVKPSGEFYVTIETFDPFHALVDLF